MSEKQKFSKLDRALEHLNYEIQQEKVFTLIHDQDPDRLAKYFAVNADKTGTKRAEPITTCAGGKGEEEYQ